MERKTDKEEKYRKDGEKVQKYIETDREEVCVVHYPLNGIVGKSIV
jgi:hypothetical protein